MKFKALKTFTSKEFAGSQYVEGMTYTIRQGNAKLADMAAKWLVAKLFIPNEDFTIMGVDFKAGKETYVLPNDELKIVIDAKVAEGKAAYTGTGLITFDFIEDTSGNVSGLVAKEIGV
jgi:hypothetical protein